MKVGSGEGQAERSFEWRCCTPCLCATDIPPPALRTASCCTAAAAFDYRNCLAVFTRPQAIVPAWKDRVRFEKIDTEENPAVADAFQVHKLPTLILFRCGGVPGAAACTLS